MMGLAIALLFLCVRLWSCLRVCVAVCDTAQAPFERVLGVDVGRLMQRLHESKGCVQSLSLCSRQWSRHHARCGLL